MNLLTIWNGRLLAGNVQCKSWIDRRGSHRSAQFHDWGVIMRFKRCMLLPGFLLLTLFTGSARADLILQVAGFSGPITPINLQPFNPALGTLNSVHVEVLGTVQLTALPPPTTYTCGFSICVTPYLFDVQVGQVFLGLGGKFFTFPTPVIFDFQGVASGWGDPVPLFQLFSYDFTFDQVSDLTGIVVPSVSGAFLWPPNIIGSRQSFTDSGFPLHEVDAISYLSLSTVPVTFPDISGSMMVEYDYTPAPAPVPEPGSLALLGSGLAGLIARRRWHR